MKSRVWLMLFFLCYGCGLLGQVESSSFDLHYVRTLSESAWNYKKEGNFSKSLTYAKLYLEVCEKVYGCQSSEYVDALLLIAINQFNLQNGAESLKTILVAKKICEENSNIDVNLKNNVITSYKRLLVISNSASNDCNVQSDMNVDDLSICGLSLMQNGEYEKAINVYEQLIKYYLNNGISEQNCELFLNSSCRIATCYDLLGKYDYADKYLRQGIRVVEQKQVKTNDLRHLYAALGVNYYYMYDFEDALSNLYKAKRLFESVNDNYSAEYAKLLGNIALILVEVGEYQKALEYNEEVASLFKKSRMTNSKEYFTVMNNLSVIYSKMKEYDKAINILQELAEETKKEKLYEEYGLVVGNMGDLYLLSKDYSNCISLIKEALLYVKSEHIRNILWIDLIVALYLSNSADYNNVVSQYDREMYQSISEIMGSFSEREWDEYWTENSNQLVVWNNLGLDKDDKTTNIRAYENTLFVKNMTLKASDIFNRLASASSNGDIIDSYNRLKGYRRDLLDRNIQGDSVNSIKNKIVDEQKFIVRNTNLSEYLNKTFVHYTDIESSLDAHEWVVEFVYRPEFDSFKFEKVQLHYGALIFCKGYDAPKYVELCLKDSFDSFMDKVSRKAYDKDDVNLYRMLWKPLEKYIAEGDVVYYSMTSSLCSVNHSAISNGKNCMGEIYNLRLLSSTGIIPHIKSVKETYLSAVIYGGINYGESVDEMVAEAKKYNRRVNAEDVLVSRGEYMRDGWQALPGTLREAEELSSLLKSRNINVRLLKSNEANEESFKSLSGDSPDILHVATHGFYFENVEESNGEFVKMADGSTEKEIIMQQSGLLFSGANNSWRGIFPKDAEDGILTSEELSRLDLSKTKLAVLSACKTGLGDSGFVDGVLGLQRGLKKAGVETIIMSLWSVDDEVTALLMRYFYESLLRGDERHESFRKATIMLKEEYPDPRYWASFVILD